MTKKLNIALVSHVDWTMHGGVQKHIFALGEALKKLDVKVTYISPTPQKDDHPTPHIQIGKLIRVPTPNGSWGSVSRTIQSPSQIRRIITEQDFDLLHFQELIAPSISWQIVKASPVPNIATFHTGWDSDATQEGLHPLIKQIGQDLKPYLTASIAVSQVAAETNRNIIKKPLHLIPNAVDLSLYTKKHPKPRHIYPKKINLLFIGRFEERKGLPHLIASLEHLPPELNKKITLNIIGSGPQEEQVKEQIHNLSNKPKINFLGFVTDKQKAAYLQHSNLFIAPSTSGESFGIVLVESLAAGTPVVAGDNDGYSLLLKDYPYHDAVLDVTKPKQLASVITKLIDDPKLRHKLSRWGKKFVTQYSAEKIAEQHISLYKQILSDHQEVQHLPPQPPHHLGYHQTAPKKQKLILLHGQKGGALRFKSVIKYLSKDYQVIAPDFPGYGSSPPNKPHTSSHYAEVIADWINAKNFTHFSLMGLSMGGIVAIKSLKHLKHHPKKLALIATPMHHRHLTLNTKQKLIKFLTHPHLFQYSQIYNSIDRIISSDRIMSAIYQLTQPRIINEKTLVYEIEQWRQQPSQIMAETAHDLLNVDLTNEPSHQVPTIYIYTPADNYVNMNLTIPAVKAILPNTTFATLDLKSHIPQGEISIKLVEKLAKSLNL